MDYMIRGTAADGQIRFFAVSCKDVVNEAKTRHKTSPVMTAALGRLLAAGLMMGSMMKDEKDLITLQIRGDGPGQGLVVSADAFGHVKGYPLEPLVLIPANDKGKLDVRGALGRGVLSVVRDTGIGEPYASQVDLVSGEIAEDLTYYYATSEQIPSSVALGVLMNKDNTVAQAGGYIIQLMPGTGDQVIDELEKRLKAAKPVTSYLSEGMSPEDIMKELLGSCSAGTIDIHEDEVSENTSGQHDLNPGLAPDMSGITSMPVSFSCNCSKERTKKVLISLGKSEITDMIHDNRPVEIHCHFCNENYIFSVKELEELIM